MRRDLLDLTGDELDLAVDDELRGADVDVIARTASEIFDEQAGIVVAEIELESRLRERR